MGVIPTYIAFTKVEQGSETAQGAYYITDKNTTSFSIYLRQYTTASGARVVFDWIAIYIPED